MRCFIFLILVVIPKAKTASTTQCVEIVGSLVCNGLADLSADVKVEVYDDDNFSRDPLFGREVTDETGSFRIKGCAADTMPFDDPDPYLYVTHECNPEKKKQHYRYALGDIWRPQVNNVGIIVIDNKGEY